MGTEFVSLITIKHVDSHTNPQDIKLLLEEYLRNAPFAEFVINDVKQFEKETSKKGTKYNFIDSI